MTFLRCCLEQHANKELGEHTIQGGILLAIPVAEHSIQGITLIKGACYLRKWGNPCC